MVTMLNGKYVDRESEGSARLQLLDVPKAWVSPCRQTRLRKK